VQRWLQACGCVLSPLSGETPGFSVCSGARSRGGTALRCCECGPRLALPRKGGPGKTRPHHPISVRPPRSTEQTACRASASPACPQPCRRPSGSGCTGLDSLNPQSPWSTGLDRSPVAGRWGQAAWLRAARLGQDPAAEPQLGEEGGKGQQAALVPATR